jgi:hypothetical protein
MMSLLLFAIFDSLLNIENHYFSREKFRCIAESGLAVRHSLRKWACIHFILFSMEIYYIFWKCWFHSFVIFYVHVCLNLNSVSKTGPESSHRYRTPKINANLRCQAVALHTALVIEKSFLYLILYLKYLN